MCFSNGLLTWMSATFSSRTKFMYLPKLNKIRNVSSNPSKQLKPGMLQTVWMELDICRATRGADIECLRHILYKKALFMSVNVDTKKINDVINIWNQGVFLWPPCSYGRDIIGNQDLHINIMTMTVSFGFIHNSIHQPWFPNIFLP